MGFGLRVQIEGLGFKVNWGMSVGPSYYSRGILGDPVRRIIVQT